jgi:hypothetical protein
MPQLNFDGIPDVTAQTGGLNLTGIPDAATFNPPKMTWGRAAAKAGIDALPGAGAVVGAVLGGGPEDVPAMALGAGAGRGLRDLIAERIGLEPETTPAGKAGRIALDTALTAATPAVLSAVKSVVLHPLESAADFIDTYAHPQKTLGALVDWLRAPKPDAPILTKPSTVTLPNTGPIGRVGTITGKAPSLTDSLKSALEDVRTSAEPIESTESSNAVTQTSAGKPSISLTGYDQNAGQTADAMARENARFATTQKLQRDMAKQMVSDIYEKATAGKGLNDWESKFIVSVDSQMKNGRNLSGAQFDIVKRIYSALPK